ncbi:hypothetical protein [Halobacteriovorax sp. HLS]|uniref:hypothetical protein n=1 Tax=Halobacteriovorax sp. HLS TaxID=2234000 RepID=UPI000FDB0243|nr:hypothetical protein [Halobacteriovorax sp. HLS]
MSANEAKDLILETSLQCYFFDLLHELNQKNSRPLPREAIFYSSLVMDKFGSAGEFFEKREGRVSEKILGIKLMESTHMPKNLRKRELKDIGDTALFICGFFSDSLNKKLVDVKYYQEIGQAAYSKLNNLVPSFYDVDSFYYDFSKKFSNVTLLMDLLAKDISANRKDERILWIA